MTARIRDFLRNRTDEGPCLVVDLEVVRDFGARTGLWVPLVVRSATIGVIAVHDRLGPDARFSDNDLRLVGFHAWVKEASGGDKISVPGATADYVVLVQPE